MASSGRRVTGKQELILAVGTLVLEAEKSGAGISQVIEVPRADRYEFGAVLTRGPEYGQIILLIGDKPIREPYDCYVAGAIAGSLITQKRRVYVWKRCE